MSKTIRYLVAGFCITLAEQSVLGSFHLMQIEQVMGGVNGNTTVQVIQLRMRAAGQNLVSQARLVVRDATGNNPVVVRDFTTNVVNSAAGSRILVATGNLPSFTNPPLTPDFTISNPIPVSYLPAGTLTFESDTGIVYWRLSWGGASYTGPGTGDITNDPDGNFNPPFSGPMPTCTTQALQFRFAAGAASTNNANDYALTAGAAVVTRNNGSSATMTGPAPATGACCLTDNSCQVASACECAGLGGTYQGDGTTCSPNPCGPANDNCADAIPIGDGVTTGTTAGATNDGSATCGSSATAPDVWYRYTASCTGELRADTCGSAYDTVLSVHSGCPGTTGNELVCNDDCGGSPCGGLQSCIAANVTAGTDYWIRVSGYNGASGDFTLNVSCMVAAPVGDLQLDGFECVPNLNSSTYDIEIDFEDNLEAPDVIRIDARINGAFADALDLHCHDAGGANTCTGGGGPCSGSCPDRTYDEFPGKNFSGVCKIGPFMIACGCTNYRVKRKLGFSLDLQVGDLVTVVLDPNDQYFEGSEANNELTVAGCAQDCNGNGVPDAGDLASGVTVDAFPIFIPDGQPIPDCDGVSDRPIFSFLEVSPSEVPFATVDDLDVDLQIQHTYVGDLSVELISPTGRTVTLMHRVGAFNPNPCSAGGGGPFGNGNNDVNVILDDQAAQSIEQQLGPINDGQTYRPGAQPGETIHPTALAEFAGDQVWGPWQLVVRDDAIGDGGFPLLGWSLHFNYRTVAPPVSRDCNRNGVPDECDLAEGTSTDINRNGIPDECEPGCCDLQRCGDWDGDCDVDLIDFTAMQICLGRHVGARGSACFQDGCGIMDLDYDGDVDRGDFGIFFDKFTGPGVTLPGCDPNAGACDAWATPADGNPDLPFGGSYTVVGDPPNAPPGYNGENPPIPADFFAPGSLPFEGVIVLKGQAEDGLNLGSTDTIVEHPPLRFGFGDLPLCDIVPARLESLSLRAKDPIVVQLSVDPADCNGNGVPDATDIAAGTSVDQNADGVPDECQWYVAVETSAIPPPDGFIAACKTHDNGGTFDATIYVQPLLVFVNKAELDAGVPPGPDNVKFLDTGVEGRPPIIFEFTDRPFSICAPSLGIYVTPCSQGNFVPGVDTSGSLRGIPPNTTCNSHIPPGDSHYFCPPECFEHACTYPATGAAFGACFDADGVAPFCAGPAVCPPAPTTFVQPGDFCNGPDPAPCPNIGFFDVTLATPGDCSGDPLCLPLTTCVQTYGPPITCTSTGVVLCP